MKILAAVSRSGKFPIVEVVSLKISETNYIRKDNTISHHDLIHAIAQSTLENVKKWKITFKNNSQVILPSPVFLTQNGQIN